MDNLLDHINDNNQLATDEGIDNLESIMLNGEYPMLDLPTTNVFTPGLYCRELFMPYGSLVTSRIHTTEHPYIVLAGAAHVFVDGEGTELLSAGKAGITMPGTRRVLFIAEDCSWVTFHTMTEEEEKLRLSGASEEELVDLLESRLFEDRELIGSDGKTNVEVRKELLSKQAIGSE